MTKEEFDTHAILLSFIASLTLADHMGDVMGDIETVLKRIGYEVPNGALDAFETALAKQLHKDGIRTLYGTEIIGDEEPDHG